MSAAGAAKALQGRQARTVHLNDLSSLQSALGRPKVAQEIMESDLEDQEGEARANSYPVFAREDVEAMISAVEGVPIGSVSPEQYRQAFFALRTSSSRQEKWSFEMMESRPRLGVCLGELLRWILFHIFPEMWPAGLTVRKYLGSREFAAGQAGLREESPQAPGEGGLTDSAVYTGQTPQVLIATTRGQTGGCVPVYAGLNQYTVVYWAMPPAVAPEECVPLRGKYSELLTEILWLWSSVVFASTTAARETSGYTDYLYAVAVSSPFPVARELIYLTLSNVLTLNVTLASGNAGLVLYMSLMQTFIEEFLSPLVFRLWERRSGQAAQQGGLSRLGQPAGFSQPSAAGQPGQVPALPGFQLPHGLAARPADDFPSLYDQMADSLTYCYESMRFRILSLWPVMQLAVTPTESLLESCLALVQQVPNAGAPNPSALIRANAVLLGQPIAPVPRLLMDQTEVAPEAPNQPLPLSQAAANYSAQDIFRAGLELSKLIVAVSPILCETCRGRSILLHGLEHFCLLLEEEGKGVDNHINQASGADAALVRGLVDLCGCRYAKVVAAALRGIRGITFCEKDVYGRYVPGLCSLAARMLSSPTQDIVSYGAWICVNLAVDFPEVVLECAPLMAALIPGMFSSVMDIVYPVTNCIANLSYQLDKLPNPEPLLSAEVVRGMVAVTRYCARSGSRKFIKHIYYTVSEQINCRDEMASAYAAQGMLDALDEAISAVVAKRRIKKQKHESTKKSDEQLDMLDHAYELISRGDAFLSSRRSGGHSGQEGRALADATDPVAPMELDTQNNQDDPDDPDGPNGAADYQYGYGDGQFNMGGDYLDLL